MSDFRVHFINLNSTFQWKKLQQNIYKINFTYKSKNLYFTQMQYFVSTKKNLNKPCLLDNIENKGMYIFNDTINKTHGKQIICSRSKHQVQVGSPAGYKYKKETNLLIASNIFTCLYVWIKKTYKNKQKKTYKQTLYCVKLCYAPLRRRGGTGVYCCANVGLLVCLSVGLSVGRKTKWFPLIILNTTYHRVFIFHM